MLNRRKFVSSTSAVAAGLTVMGAAGQASAKSGKLPVDVDPRGAVGRLERLPQLDLESRQDFMQGLTAFSISGDLAQAARDRGAAILKAKGLDPAKELPVDTANALLESDPIIAMRDRVWYSAHNYEHDILDDYFQRNAQLYLAELDAADKAGPGRLELDPTLQVPDYTRHEIHQQPGGYVGNPFAGHLYHYATNMFYRGTNDQDQRHTGYAAGCPLPANGQVKRILDLGTGIGQLALAMKGRFPQAEVTGLDVAAPMLRYAHMRAVDLDTDITFTQRLAEDTRYPDGHFDIVISYILFHEVTAAASRRIIAEAYRILRPGGVFYPMDFNQVAPPSALRLYGEWKDHHWNNERWRLEYASVNFDQEMRKVGFAVDQQSDQRSIFGRVIATKPA
jgi:ubiquinone/menaquinone biosynthesis C-methylase UbiE